MGAYEEANIMADLERQLAEAKAREDGLKSQLAKVSALMSTRTDGLASIQRHRDRWRGYAYGKNSKPQDFLDGNIVNRPMTRIEHASAMLATVRPQLKEADGKLLAVVDAALAAHGDGETANGQMMWKPRKGERVTWIAQDGRWVTEFDGERTTYTPSDVFRGETAAKPTGEANE